MKVTTAVYLPALVMPVNFAVKAPFASVFTFTVFSFLPARLRSTVIDLLLTKVVPDFTVALTEITGFFFAETFVVAILVVIVAIFPNTTLLVSVTADPAAHSAEIADVVRT